MKFGKSRPTSQREQFGPEKRVSLGRLDDRRGKVENMMAVQEVADLWISDLDQATRELHGSHCDQFDHMWRSERKIDNVVCAAL